MKTLKNKDLKEFYNNLADYFDNERDFKNEVLNVMQIFNVDAYHAGRYLVESGSFAVYYDDQRDELAKLYEQTKDEASKYSDEKVFERYKALVSRICKNIIESPKNLGL